MIERELIAAGFAEPDKILLVCYDGLSTAACGGAARPPDLVGSVGALYLRGEPAGFSCDTLRLASAPAQAGYWEHSAIHEALHVTGAVPSCAPT